MIQLKNDKASRNGMPWRRAPHFSITFLTTGGVMESVAATREKSKERVGIVKFGVRGVGLGLGFGFLRWWSLMREWNFSASWVSAGDSLVSFWGVFPSC